VIILHRMMAARHSGFERMVSNAPKFVRAYPTKKE